MQMSADGNKFNLRKQEGVSLGISFKGMGSSLLRIPAKKIGRKLVILEIQAEMSFNQQGSITSVGYIAS